MDIKMSSACRYADHKWKVVEVLQSVQNNKLPFNLVLRFFENDYNFNDTILKNICTLKRLTYISKNVEQILIHYGTPKNNLNTNFYFSISINKILKINKYNIIDYLKHFGSIDEPHDFLITIF